MLILKSHKRKLYKHNMKIENIESTHPIEAAWTLRERLDFCGKDEMGLNEKQDPLVVRWKGEKGVEGLQKVVGLRRSLDSIIETRERKKKKKGKKHEQ